jgi:hypothetical protein
MLAEISHARHRYMEDMFQWRLEEKSWSEEGWSEEDGLWPESYAWVNRPWPQAPRAQEDSPFEIL